MASYNADINVNVKVFDQQLRKLENRIKQLDKIANPKKPLTRAQASEELEGAKRLAEQLRKGKRALEEQDALRQKRINKDRVRLQQAKEELAYEERLLRIQNARNLQEARLTALERAGAFKGKGRASEINKLKAKAQQFPENAAIQERVATALGRILTLQNAINRGEIKSVGQKQRIADYNARINALRKVGATEGQLKEILKRRYEFTEAADKRQTALADRRELQLKRQIKLLEKRYELELKASRASAPIQSSPLSSGPARTVLGTPQAEERKRKYYERLADREDRERRNRARRRTTSLSSALVGGGFPLLFGQGVGASVGGALGGGLGALGGQQLGFGLSLIGTVVGQAFDNIVAGAQDLGKALNPLTADIGALATAAGLAGTETEKLLKAVEAQVGATAAQALAAEQLAAIVGDSGVAALKELGEESQRLSNSLTKALTALKAAISPLVAEILRATASNVDRTRLVGSALSQGFLGVEIKPDFQNVPELIKAVEKFNKGLINEKDLQKLATLVALSRELEKQSEANVKAFQALFNASSRTVQIAQINLDLALAQNGVYGEGAAALERQAALQERLARDAKLRREAESDPAKAAQLANNLAESRIKYERSILDIQRKQQQGMLDAARQRLELARDYLSVEEKINQATLERTRETGRLLEQLKRAAIEERNAETGRIVAGSKLISAGSDPIGVKKEEIRLANLLQKREQERLQIEHIDAIQAGLRSKTELDHIDKKYKSLKEAASLEYVSNWINLQLDLERLKVAEARAEANAKATFTSKRDTLQAKLDSPLGGDRYEQEILAIEQRNRRLSETSALIDKIEAQEKVAGGLRTQGRIKDAERIEEVINKDRKKLDLRQQELTLLEQLEMRELKLGQAIEKILPVATAFADGLTQGLQGIIDGTMSAEEAFAKMLRGMADALMQAAATMIAQYIAIGIAKAFAGMSGGGGSNRGGTKPNQPFFEGLPFAEGGFVSGPTRALIGEGSQPEYVIPENKMGEAMSRYNAGARGSSVIPGKGDGGSAAATSGGGAVINYNGPTLNFNSEDYVPTSAVAGIIDEATKRGAKAGEARTFATLRNSRSQRSRIGI